MQRLEAGASLSMSKVIQGGMKGYLWSSVLPPYYVGRYGPVRNSDITLSQVNRLGVRTCVVPAAVNPGLGHSKRYHWLLVLPPCAVDQ